jgi:transposase
MAKIVREPEEILDAEHEQILERVCAIDVAKESGQVCLRVPGTAPGGRRSSKVWTVNATTNAVLRLGESLAEQRVEMVTLESTSDYWRIFYYLLEACGVPVQLVNARDVKNVPGRPKTDKIDAVWLAKLTERGMLRPSFVPAQPLRVLRDYTRTRIDLTRDRTRHWQRLEKLLEDALIKISAVASTMTTASVRDMIEALISGEHRPDILADLARGAMRSKRPALIQALTGQFDEHHAELAAILLNQIDHLTTQIEHLTGRIEQRITELPDTNSPHPTTEPPDTTEHPYRSAITRLADIPGISTEAAQVIIAEIGTDMTRFPTPQHLTSWAHLSPRLIQSGPKRRGGNTSRGNPYLKGALGVAAASASRTNTFLGERYKRIVKHRGKGKALVAVARSILVAIWHLLTNPTTNYHDLGPDYHLTHINTQRKIRNHIQQLQALGYTVTLTPAAA